jgi:hypothetical protein
MTWLDVLAAREILSGAPVFYYPRYGGIIIPDEVIFGRET